MSSKPKKNHIMVVDDDTIILFMMKHNIKLNGLHDSPTTFENGQLALEHVRENYNMNDSFVIFLDINMPVLNGWQFLDKIKEFAMPTNTLVFILSSSTDEADIEKAFASSYVVDYLTKPVLADKYAQIKELLGMRI